MSTVEIDLLILLLILLRLEVSWILLGRKACFSACFSNTLLHKHHIPIFVSYCNIKMGVFTMAMKRFHISISHINYCLILKCIFFK